MKLAKTFFDNIRALIVAARTTVARGVDHVQVHTNFEIGRRIVEQEQKGKDRAVCGKKATTESWTSGSIDFSPEGVGSESPGHRPGSRSAEKPSPERARFCRRTQYTSPFQGFPTFRRLHPGRCPGLSDRAPLGLHTITLPKDANIHAREYQLYLPSKAELKRKLIEWTGDREADDE